MEEEVKITEETPRGRAGVLAKFMRDNPEFEGDPSDDELWDYAGNDYDAVKGNYRKVMEGQKGLHDYVAKDPRFGAAIGMSFGDGEDKVPFMQALGRLYGKDAFDDSEEFMRGVEEFNSKYNKDTEDQQKAQENFETLTAPRLEQFAKDNNLTDEQLGEIGSGLMAMAEGMIMGDIPLEAIELVYKGLNYDTDVQEAAVTGEIEGKNQKIRAEMKKRESPDGVVDMGAGTGSKDDRRPPLFQPRPGSVYDELKEVE